MIDEKFNLYRADESKLLAFGFKANGENFVYKTQILDGQFEMTVMVDKASRVKTQLIDSASGEEYVLHLAGGVGEFVGRVRSEHESVLERIKASCFYREVHRSNQAKQVTKFIKQRYGDEIEYLWKKFPTDAIWRRKDNKKWYALIMTIPRNRLKISGDDLVEVLDVRVDAAQGKELVDNKTYFPGYHMNKAHWITFILDDSLSDEQIFKLIDDSHDLAK